MKTQIKKSLSLFLAVLMILSCWVWVAPEKAEAGSVSATTYTVEIQWTISQRNCDGGDITYRTLGNGWGSESSYKTALSSMSDKKEQGTYTYSWTTDEFPSVVKITTKGGFVASNPSRCVVNYLKINGKTVFDGGTGKVAFNLPTWKSGASASAEMYPNYTDTDNSGTSGNLDSGYNWPRPMIAGFVDSGENAATAPDISLTLNKVGEQKVSGTTSYDLSGYTFYDQYGKAIADGDKATFLNNSRFSGEITTTTHVAGTNNSDDATENTDIWVNPENDSSVVVSPNLQISDPKGSTGATQYFLVRTYKVKDSWGGEQTSKVSAPINITYPKYDVKFDAGLSQAELKDSSGTLGTGSYTGSNYNGGTIQVPTTATAEGYTFYDFWSKPQPTTGDASYNASEADFATPCSTEDYNAYKATGTESNGIVTDADGNKWYDAGKKLDPSTAKTINVEGKVTTPNDTSDDLVTTWYGWWIAKDLSVKFYDVDGSFLGEKLVKSGQTQKDITWPTSKYINSGYTSGAFKFKVDGDVWEATDGTEINKNSYTFTKDLILTPKLTDKDYTDKYAVSFINPNNGNSVTVGTEGGNYNYRWNISTHANEALGKIAETPNDVNSDLEFSYELLGWSSVKPTTGKNYHVLLEDADFDVNGTAIGLNSDWVVRDTATYYAVYRRHTKTYVVNFNYKDATGADATRQLKVKYGANLVPPTEYVPYSYVTKGFGYTFDMWSYANADGEDATLDYGAAIPFTSEYISIEGAALDGTADLDPIDITATYGAPVATPYTVTFNYVDSRGDETASSVQVRNEQFILQGTVDNLNPAEKWENDNQLYTYAGKWEITEGSATVGVGGAEKKVGDIIDTADLITLTPTSNITFKAVYANPIPYFTVTYIDGDKTFSERVLQDSNVPEWTDKVTNDNGTPDDKTDDFEEDKIYVPADYEGEGGTYEFQGWFDQDGNKVTTADKVTDNLTLTSKFKFEPDKFLIKFMNHDGTVQLGAGEFEKGLSIEALVTTATKAAQGRASDETYDYLFLGWDKPVPTFCEGSDITFTAQYKPVYKYYDVKWYNSKLVDGKWVADKSTSVVDGKDVETYLLATTHHTYNSKLYTPAVDSLVCLETAPAGQNYVFAGWYYNDAEGNAVKYERGMLVTAEMEFYATYALTAKTYTVTTVVKGVETKYTVASGATAEIPEPQAGYVDATKHDAFDGWYTDEECTTAFSADTVITADTKIYAKFTEGEHDFAEKELVTAPTYYEAGEMAVWCSCDKAETKKTETINKLQDTKTPTGTIYLGGLGQWASTDEIGGAALDGGEITIYANADTDVIITANDTGDVNELYNPAGLGKGIKYIRAFIYPGKFETLTAESYGAAQSLTTDVYVDETTDATNNANFAVKLGDFIVADLDEDGKPQYDENGNVKFKALESGESYIVYYYVVDKAGNQLRTKVRTAKFIYDNTAPVFTVDGESNEAIIPTYCGVATVKGIEKGAVLTVNGEVVTATFADGAETGTYEIKYAEGIDNVIITATDKAGNTYSKKIKVADHSYLLTEQKSTCGVAGFKKEECIICGYVKTNDEYPALDHIYSQREVIPADCVNIGSIVVTCEICGEKITTVYEEDGVTPVVPELGHVFAKDDNDEIIYTTVTESTCKTKGLAEAYCTECNGELEGGYITKALELDPKNHEDITVTEVEPDCINDGYYTEICVCGEIIVSRTAETNPESYKAKGHGTIEAGTAEWYVRTEPTCYQKGEKVLKCLVCSNFVEVDGEEVTEEIAATGEHVKTVTNPDTYKTDGVVKYHCATEGCTHKYADKPYVNTALKEYTVTFKNEAGTVIKTFKVLEGTYIAKDAVTAPEKAATKEYKYSFAGWSDGNKTYKLPLEVTSNLTLQATYKATKILYTHQFLIPAYDADAKELDYDNTVAYRNLLGAIGDERVPAGTPVVDTGSDTTFKFKGWKRVTTGADANEIVTDFIVAEDKTFVAMFDTEVAVYDVVFYNGYDYVWNTTVPSGSKVTFEGEEPTKDPDAKYHYTFNGWYTDLSGEDKFNFNTAITGKTRLYAGYTATEHTMELDVDDERNVDATCTTAGAEVYACKYCDYDEVRTVNALDHDWEYDWTNEDGVKGDHCKVCGEFVEAAANKFTVKFMNGKSTLAKYTIVEGNKIVLDVELEPTKVEDAEFKYTFNGKWACNNKEYTLSQILEMAIDADYTFEACYDKTKQVYKVSYIDDDNNIIVTKDVEYGETLYAFEGTNPTRERDDLYHYEFKGWDKEAGKYVIKGDTYVSPEFDKFDHVFGEEEITEATCTEAGSTVKSCECGYKQIQKVNIPALGHTDVIDEATGEKVEHTIVKPTYKTEGSDSYVCQRCGVVVTIKLDKLPSTEIVITVKDANGNLAVDGSAKVTITNKNNAADTQFNFTDMNGQVRFTVAAGQEWIVGITGNNLPQGGYGFELGKGESSYEASPDKEVEDDDHGCSCSCHRTSFWGIIFRLFQKFIRLFTGKIGCCSDPDPMYG